MTFSPSSWDVFDVNPLDPTPSPKAQAFPGSATTLSDEFSLVKNASQPPLAVTTEPKVS